MNQFHRESVETVRRALLEFHKRLIEAARIEYEKEHGRIASSGEYLRLLTEEESFAWLRPFSSLILALDELGEMSTATDEDAAAARIEVERLLGISEDGSSEHFRPLLETIPDTVIALSKLQQALLRLPVVDERDAASLRGRRASWIATPKSRS